MCKKGFLAFSLIMFISCAGQMVLVPPEVDLLPYDRIGLISFSVENAEGRLDELATQRFLQDITRFQRGVQIIELGPLDEVLGKVGNESLDHDAMAAIREQFGVTAFFHGKIKVSDVKPDVDIAALIKSLSVRATFNISMTGRLFSTETGATLWTDSVFRKESLANMSISPDQIPYFDVRDQDETTKMLVENMIYDLTRDFRPTKRRMKKIY